MVELAIIGFILLSVWCGYRQGYREGRRDGWDAATHSKLRRGVR